MATKPTILKKKKKAWYQIHAPKILNNVILGESTVYGKEELKGKSLKLNLSTIVNDMRKQHLDVFFRVSVIVENKGLAEVTGISLVQSYIKRLVRRGRDKVDDSFLVKSKDRKILRIKPLLVTNYRTNRSVNSRLRLETREVIRRILSKTDADEFFHMIITGKIQKEIKDKINKIYPLKHVEIRIAQYEKDKGKEIKEVSDEELAETAASDEEIEEEAEKLETEESEESEDSNEFNETEDSEESEEFDDSESDEEVEEKPKKKK